MHVIQKLFDSVLHTGDFQDAFFPYVLTHKSQYFLSVHFSRVLSEILLPECVTMVGIASLAAIM